MTTLRRSRNTIAVALVLLLISGVVTVLPELGRAERVTVVGYFDNSNGIFVGDEVQILGVPVGAITYLMETEDGLKPDVMFCYDLELDASFTPRNTDGEIEGFELWPIRRLAERVRDTDDFKFNVNLVVIDFLIRHGYLKPDDEPDYLALLAGLRRHTEGE